jgi:hypothetical protein
MTVPQNLPKIAITLPAQTIEVDMKGGVDPQWYQTFALLVAFAKLFSSIDFNTLATNATFKWDATNQRFTAS